MTTCLYHQRGLAHPYFAYILTDKRFNHDKASQTVVAKIGISRHPIHRLNCHNRRPGYKVGASTKSTKAGAGHYQLEFIVGPFYNGQATRFKKKWTLARKPMPRLLQGIRLAGRYRYKVWARDTAWLKKFASGKVVQ